MTDAHAFASRISTEVDRYVVDAEASTHALLIALLARGHALIEGVPGTGKTLLVRVFAALLGLEYRRIQFTPDLMPSDIVGTTVFNPQTATFSVRSGPIVANVVLADEINRTPAKTQAALLEAMEEGRVTIDGTSLILPAPFFVCATQNPVEYEGTYPLPEAQLDRFFVKVPAGYPTREAELTLLRRVCEGFDPRSLESIAPITSTADVLAAQKSINAIHVAESVRGYIYDIVTATRAHSRLTLGASPRAAVALMIAAQANAAIEGRTFSSPDDVKRVAPLVLGHRLIVIPEAEIEGFRSVDILSDILKSIPVPRE
ncbi:MAG: AAA family ATPase [Vulcanimicrobiaceae bacterium]